MSPCHRTHSGRASVVLCAGQHNEWLHAHRMGRAGTSNVTFFYRPRSSRDWPRKSAVRKIFIADVREFASGR